MRRLCPHSRINAADKKILAVENPFDVGLTAFFRAI
jgi:hypothetical protein